MNGRQLSSLVVVLLATSGCVASSLHPLSDEAHVVGEPRLFGSWTGVSPPKTVGSLFDETYWNAEGDWVIEPAASQSFRAVHRVDGATSFYAGRVVSVGHHLFLDLVPDSAQSARCELFPSIPCHAFFLVQFVQDTLVVGYLRSDWLASAAAKGLLPAGTGLAFTEDDEAVLTGKSPELQQIMLRAVGDSAAFSMGKLARAR